MKPGKLAGNAALPATPLLLLVACGAEPPPPMMKPPPKPKPVEAPQLGTGDHGAASVTLTLIADRSAGLRVPRALAFNPLRPEELWVVNRGDDGAVIIHNAPSPDRSAERRKDAYALHFMAHPSSIAFGDSPTTFGAPGTFATCQESRNTYDDTQPANDFMGSTLWSSDLSIFAKKDPMGLGSHIDMLHEGPDCMGIAWEKKNVYWAFAGLHNEIIRYDFQKDHGIGNDDHSDGTIHHYARGEVQRVPEVPSHLAFSAKDRMLFIADTGNGRIARLDTTTGKRGADLRQSEPEAENSLYVGAVITDFVPAGPDLSLPSGLLLHGDYLFVSDNDNGRISAYNLMAERVNYLDTGLKKGALMGMAFGPDDKLYLVDAVNNKVLRIDVPPK